MDGEKKKLTQLPFPNQSVMITGRRISAAGHSYPFHNTLDSCDACRKKRARRGVMERRERRGRGRRREEKRRKCMQSIITDRCEDRGWADWGRRVGRCGGQCGN